MPPVPESRGRTPRRKARRGPTPRSTRAANDDQGELALRRVTPARSRGPFRPVSHKVIGIITIIIGLGLFAINDLALLDVNLMPGGHNEIWAPVALVIAASSMWWFGWFDRPTERSR